MQSDVVVKAHTRAQKFTINHDFCC